MKSRRIPFLALSITALAAAPLSPLGDSLGEQERLYCSHACAWTAAPPDAVGAPQYAPDRKVDILHLALDVTPDFKKRTVAGQATITFKPIAKPLEELRLDAVDLTVREITATARIAAWQATEKEVIVTFEKPIAPDAETKVTIRYAAEPVKGLYFRTPEMGYPAGDTHLFTQGESIEARHWYPCHDFPNEKFTSEITCRVPEGMTVLSNGRLMSSEKDPATGLVAVRWLQDKPHVNYLVSLLAGYFKKIEDKYRDIPLEFYTAPSDIGEAANSFRGTKEMMAFFEKEIGVPYPWAKYTQVCVADFHFGGMENTSITTLTDRTLHRAETEPIDSSEVLVAHELVHQWFGNLVTCKDWSHLWLNEGFATYYQWLYAGHKHGRDALLYGLYNDARRILGAAGDVRSIVTRKFDNPQEQFSHLAYQKGGWVLHMLRSQLGGELFRRCIKSYLERHAFGIVVTEDLNAVVEELSGRSYDRFFDQWVCSALFPEIEAAYSWDEKTKLAKVSIRQVQKKPEAASVFTFPLTIRFKSKSATTDRQVSVMERDHDFYFPLPAAPEIVRLDPDYTLLAKIEFKLPQAMLYAQLADHSDMIGRLLACEQLAGKKDRETVAKLKLALNSDPFYGVRIKAAEALNSIHTDEALEALLASAEQPDARARDAVVKNIGNFYHPSACDALRRIATTDKNPAIQATAIRALGAYAKPELRDLLIGFLNSTSYRDRLAEAAIAAIRTRGESACISPLRECLARRENEFKTPTLVAGLDALAFLARHEQKKDDVREFIARYLNHPRQRVKLGAIAALGTLEDPKAIAALDTFTTMPKDGLERQAADKALAAINAARKPDEHLRDLHGEVTRLQDSQRELRKELEALKKKFDALAPKPTPAKGSKPANAAKKPKP
ncbi:MAG: M1 family metallopeptidase [Verrucomicrobiae bacterium]|nr:M1 family metallopeptidase [Verrucomicrobiae bacterium]